MGFLPFLDFFSLLVYLYLAISILIKNPGSLLSRVCSSLLLCFAIWSLEMVFVHNPLVSKDIVRLFSNIGSLGWISFSSFFLWFSLIFTKNKKILRIKLFYFLIVILPLILIYKEWTGSLIVDFIKEPYGWAHVFAKSIWTYLFYFYYTTSMAISLYLIFAFGKRVESTRKKKQAKIIFNTAIIPLIAGTFTDVILPEMQVHSFPSIGDIITLVWAFGLTYSMFKYKFLAITPTTAAENIISIMSDSLILLDRKGEIVTVNKALQDLLGYRMDEIKGQSADILFGKDALDKVIKEGRYKNYDIFFKTKSGLDIPIDLSASVLKDEEKEIVGIVCIARDITERKQAEEELSKRKDMLERASSAGKTALRDWDLSTNALEWSAIIDELLGYEKGGFPRTIGAWEDIIYPDDKPQVMQKLNNHLEKRAPYAAEYRVKKKDNTYIWWHDNGQAYWDKEGKAYRMFGACVDITERKQAEEELRLAYKKLQQTQAELIQTSKMAAMGQLATGVSHELNQPLTGIKGFAQAVLMDLEKESPFRNDLNKIVGQVDRMDTIIKNVRFFARRSDFKIVELDINQVVSDSLMLLSQQLKTHNIKVIQELGSDIPKMQGDPNQLQQAFLNIISNARDAILSLNRPEGGEIRIQISLSQDKEHIEISFQDTGCGIPEGSLQHIFSPFYTTKSPDRGIGLGLSITYRIIENHQGKIEFKSKEGQGTTFSIALPLERKEDETGRS